MYCANYKIDLFRDHISAAGSPAPILASTSCGRPSDLERAIVWSMREHLCGDMALGIESQRDECPALCCFLRRNALYRRREGNCLLHRAGNGPCRLRLVVKAFEYPTAFAGGK
jgi:hypothetical protein